MILGGSPLLRRAHTPLGFAERRTDTGADDALEYTPIEVADGATAADLAEHVETVGDLLLAEYDRLTADGRTPSPEEDAYLESIRADYDALKAARDSAEAAETERAAKRDG